MSSISSLGDSSSDSFDVNDDNNGQIVASDAYENDDGYSRRDIANSIMSQLGGGKAFGFNLSDVVNAMVQGDMMDEIPDIERNITNTNVRVSAVSEVENLMSELKKTTLTPTEAGVSPYTITSSDSANISIQNDSNGSDTPYMQPFSVTVSSLATTDSEYFETGEASASTTISGSGSLEISLGSGDPVTISISADSNLTSIATQINQTDSDVTASVVKGGDGNYHLAIVSNNTGSSNAITFDTSGLTGDLKTMLDSHSTKQAAADAQYTINGIPLSSANNTISYSGVSLSLNGAGTATISAVANTSSVAQSVSQFVQNYNELIGKINDIMSSKPGKSYRGSLYKDSDMLRVKEELRDTMVNTLSNGNSLMNLGIDFNGDGTLSLNQSQLFTALNDNPQLADTILATHLTATNSNVTGVSYNKVGDAALAATQSGTYDVNITQAASTAALTATGAIPSYSAGNVTLGSSVTLDVTVTGLPNPGKFDGDTSTVPNIQVTIPAGTYSASTLAQNIQNQINDATGVSAANASVGVKIDSTGHLQITSQAMGSQTSFTINSSGSSNLSDLGLSGTDIDTQHHGQDVEGTINNQLCFGEGYYLEAQDDPTYGDNASGLIIKYVGTTTGSMGTVTLSKGYSSQLDDLVSNMTNYVQNDPNASGILALKAYNYQQDLDPNNLNSLVQKLKEAKAKQDQLTQMYLSRYQNVNSILQQMSDENSYLDQMFNSNSNNQN